MFFFFFYFSIQDTFHGMHDRFDHFFYTQCTLNNFLDLLFFCIYVVHIYIYIYVQGVVKLVVHTYKGVRTKKNDNKHHIHYTTWGWKSSDK